MVNEFTSFETKQKRTTVRNVPSFVKKDFREKKRRKNIHPLLFYNLNNRDNKYSKTQKKNKTKQFYGYFIDYWVLLQETAGGLAVA